MPGRIALASLPAAAILVAGSLCVHLLPALPDARLALGAALIAAPLALFATRFRLPALLLFGFAWTAWHAARSLSIRLPHALEGRDLALVVDVADLPRVGADAVRFDASIVEATDADGEPRREARADGAAQASARRRQSGRLRFRAVRARAPLRRDRLRTRRPRRRESPRRRDRTRALAVLEVTARAVPARERRRVARGT